MNHLRNQNQNWKNENTDKILKKYTKNRILKVKNSFLELEKDFKELRDRELKDREIEDLIFRPN